MTRPHATNDRQAFSPSSLGSAYVGRAGGDERTEADRIRGDGGVTRVAETTSEDTTVTGDTTAAETDDGTQERDVTTALTAYLHREITQSVERVEPLSAGLNRHFLVGTTDESRAYVVRAPRLLRESFYMNTLADEYAVLERLQSTPIETPEPVAYCADQSVIGSDFFVTTHLAGEEVPLGSRLPERYRTPSARQAIGEQLVDTLGEIHDCDTAAFSDVCTRRQPLVSLDRSLARLDDGPSLPHGLGDRLRSLGAWLRSEAPTDPDLTLAHGDYRPGNVLFAGDQPTITGVIDWETAWLGDPLVDLGYLLMRWRDDGDATPDLSAFDTLDTDDQPDDGASVLTDLRERNERGFAPFTNAPGSPSRRELIDRYERRTGRTYRRDRFYRTLSAFQLATVWVDLYRLDGDTDRLAYVEYVTRIAELIRDGHLPN